MTHEICGICGKLTFPDKPFAGFDDWYICKNPRCPMFNGKFRAKSPRKNKEINQDERDFF